MTHPRQSQSLARQSGSGQIIADENNLSIPDLQFDNPDLQTMAIGLKAFMEKALGVGTNSNDRYVRVDDLVAIGLIRIVDGKIFAGDRIAPVTTP